MDRVKTIMASFNVLLLRSYFVLGADLNLEGLMSRALGKGHVRERLFKVNFRNRKVRFCSENNTIIWKFPPENDGRMC